MLCVAFLIALLSSMNYSCKSQTNCKDTLNSNKMLEAAVTTNQTETEEYKNNESIIRSVQWRLKIGRTRRSRNRIKAVNKIIEEE